jgi:hypothetical protein
MDRIIKNYDVISNEFLYQTDDWDLVELNYTLDIDKLTAWYKQLSTDFEYMRFMFDKFPEKLELSISKRMVEEGYCGYYCGPIDGITLAWPEERYEPLPPPAQANSDIFPEVKYDTFIDDAKIMTKFRAGYLQEMVDILGEDSFRQAIITTHYPGMYIRQHIDSKVLKLHIPVETNEHALFHFGENKERSYHMKLGKIYLLNTNDWHGTTNESDTKRSHIITRIIPEHVQYVLGLKNENN